VSAPRFVDATSITMHLDQGWPLLLTAPTGSGKTTVIVDVVSQDLARGGLSIVVAPFRALLAEIAERLRTHFGPDAVGVFTGESTEQPGDDARVRIALLTPERLELVTRRWRQFYPWLATVRSLVVDEIHLLREPGRGGRLDAAVHRFARINPLARRLYLSGSVGEPGRLADALGAIHIDHPHRVVPLRWKHETYKNDADKREITIGHTQRVTGEGGSLLIFCASRKRTETVADALRNAGIDAEAHHAALPSRVRADREARFRARTLPVLACTSTLEAGVSLPARTVVIYDAERYDGAGWSPLPVASVRQRAGRAGRFGLEEEGEVIVLQYGRGRHVDYERAPVEAAGSKLVQRVSLAEAVIAEVDAGLARTPAQLDRALAGTVAGRQGALQVGAAVASMRAAGMLLEAEDGTLRVTRAGRIAVRHLLLPETVATLLAYPQGEREDTPLELIRAACATPDASRLVVDDSIHAAVAEAHGITDTNRRDAHATAAVLLEWTATGDAARVAERFDLAEHDLRLAIDAASRCLAAWAGITSPTQEDIAAGRAATHRHRLLRQLAASIRAGMSGPVAELLLVPGVGPAWAARLAAAGVGDLEALAQAAPEDIVQAGLSLARAEEWIESAGDLVGQGLAGTPEIQMPRIVAEASEWTFEFDRARLRRARTLRVEAVGVGLYRVSGGRSVHAVNDGTCDCPDADAPSGACKHLLAVRLHVGDPIVASAVALVAA
jgi:helicase